MLVISNVVTLLLALYVNTKVDSLKYLVDRAMRAEALEMITRPEADLAANGIMVVIPALNEADNLRILLPHLPKQVCGSSVGVLVIDDGSRTAPGMLPWRMGATWHGFRRNAGRVRRCASATIFCCNSTSDRCDAGCRQSAST